VSKSFGNFENSIHTNDVVNTVNTVTHINNIIVNDPSERKLKQNGFISVLCQTLARVK